MAKYDVTYSCGHEGTVSLYGKHVSRERKLEWYADSALCPDCWEQKKQSEREFESARSTLLNLENGLVPLAGSEKQVAWAETIRARKVDRLLEILGELQRQLDEALHPFLDECVEWVRTQQDAKFWIDRRDRPDRDVAAILIEAPSFGPIAEAVGGDVKERWLERQEKKAEAEAQREQDEKISRLRAESQQRIAAVFGPTSVAVTVWNERDKRIYIDAQSVRVEFYCEGNRYAKAESLKNQSSADDAAVRELCEWLCQNWKSVRIHA